MREARKEGHLVAEHGNERHESAYLRTSEVAELLHVSPKTVSRWAKEGKLPFLKTLGGHRRYPEADIRQLADELREAPNGI
jgi:excisionase family DNA binding protein